ncbi:MAG TPA: SDR family oxidoreductase [Oligoflexus sp.]|uniref:SDR family oxidoreductase n=1 Tax=Oligoflexus sp. TaxID=1971216 RepID=UPI002D80C57F|nr:SDR family oxidoreductase [Oligoflexus sp.]HET9238103.1 SDR family oxidoreductase [Oligoflexus sp.]
MSQTVCITGAARGLGLGYTEHYLEAGWQVLAVARKAKEKDSLKKLAQKYGSRLELFDADLTNHETLLPLKKCWESQPLDLLINNAGILLDGHAEFEKLRLDTLRESFEVNVIAPVALTQMALPALQKSKKPVVAMMSTLMASIADNASGGYYAYRSSKTALNMVTRSLANDCPWLIAIALHPGWVQTDMGGAQAPTSVTESIQGLTRVIAGLKADDSGQFRNFKGQTLPW